MVSHRSVGVDIMIQEDVVKWYVCEMENKILSEATHCLACNARLEPTSWLFIIKRSCGLMAT
jgi:hypothetical protein